MSKEKTRFALALFAMTVAIVFFYLLPPTCPKSAQKMIFIFILAAFFWVFEIIPLFATSLLVVILEIFLLPDKYQFYLSPFANPIIFLFLGGFVLAAALTKYQLDRELAERILSIFGNKPLYLTIGFMSTAAFFSFWMSATATTAMMLALIAPLISQISINDPFRKILVLSIPIGARIGGLCTPIGTPPNAIAAGILEQKGIHVSFISWMSLGLPLAVLLLFVSIVTLFLLYKPLNEEMKFNLPKVEKIQREGKVVFIIGLSMILLWLTTGFHKIPEAVVSLAGIAMYFGFNLLDRNDLKKIDWDILILMWGGLALGEGMESSGLTHWVIGLPLFDHTGIVLIAAFCILATGISTFMSNTTAANLLLPIVVSFPTDNPVVFTLAVALCCSFDIPLPISSPPNALAFSTKVITVKDLLKSGIPVTLVAVGLIILGSKLLLTFPIGPK